jgi:hypothetical protein
VESEVVAKMERGVGGRIEEAFAQAKQRGEAAFVTFVTAGYPSAAGTYDTQKGWNDGSLQVACLTALPVPI